MDTGATVVRSGVPAVGIVDGDGRMRCERRGKGKSDATASGAVQFEKTGLGGFPAYWAADEDECLMVDSSTLRVMAGGETRKRVGTEGRNPRG